MRGFGVLGLDAEQGLWEGVPMTTTYHLNVADGSSVKGVPCRRCGEEVGLVKSRRTGRWYTCQLVPSMNPDSYAKRAYPFMPHAPNCRSDNDLRQERQERERREADDLFHADEMARQALISRGIDPEETS